jgi:hypothetical protein
MVVASNAYNQVIEKDFDKLMIRTANRPVATNRMGAFEASIFSMLLGISGVLIISLYLNPLSGWLALGALISYAFIYTPLKRISPVSVFVGAVPGAIGGAFTGEPGAGAAIGAGAAVLAPAVASIVSKGAGSVIDALAGRTADVRANRLIRLAANDEVNALRQAMAAQPDVPASRAAANLNLPLLQALLQRAEQRDPQQVVNAFRQRESQDIVNELTRIAGGATAETARAAREGAKGTLAAVTGARSRKRNEPSVPTPRMSEPKRPPPGSSATKIMPSTSGKPLKSSAVHVFSLPCPVTTIEFAVRLAVPTWA